MGLLKKLKALLGGNVTNKRHPFEIGEKYLVRTVTMIISGILIDVYDTELVFKDAAWIADTGRFHDALKDAKKVSEVEPFIKDVIVGRGALIDMTIWDVELPREQK